MIEEASLSDAARALHTGSVTLESYVDAARDRFEEYEPEIHAFVPETDRWGRLADEAAALAERYPDDDPEERLPLYGVPVGVKDIIHVDGLPTKAGTELPEEVLTGSEAAVVTSLREAGALVAGKTVTTEFAYAHPGPTRNPHALDCTPGGSSSGSAAAVAAGLCPLALGTQTVGSVIRPAAFCGVVGVKPSFGRIPTEGVIPFSPSLDHVGFFVQDVAGARLAAATLYEEWTPADAYEDLRLGIPSAEYLSRASDVGAAHFEAHVEALERAGYETVDLGAPADFAGVEERHQRLKAADAALVHHEWYNEYGDRYSEATADLIAHGREVTVEQVATCRESRLRFREEVHEAMDDTGVDVVVSPAAPGPAPRGLEDTGNPILNLPWTHAGLPTATLPASADDEGRPLGLQCTARYGEDERLLASLDGLRAALPEAGADDR